MHYVENALEVKNLNKIPKLNSKYNGINKSFENYKVIAINTYENDDHEQYLFYKVYYQDTTIHKEFYFQIDCCYFEYCIRKSNI